MTMRFLRGPEEKQKPNTIIFPSYQPVHPSQEYTAYIHARALQRLLLLTQIFDSTEVGTYLLTRHETEDQRRPPPIDTTFLYAGQVLSGARVHPRDEYAPQNDKAIAKLNQRRIGEHHSHCHFKSFESPIDLDAKDIEVSRSPWTMKHYTPLVSALPPKAVHTLKSELQDSPGEYLDTASMEHAQLYEETRGLITIVSNLRGHVLTNIHFSRYVPTICRFQAVPARLRPFLYQGEQKPELEETLESLLVEINDKIETFVFEDPVPHTFQSLNSPSRVLETIVKRTPLVSRQYKLLPLPKLRASPSVQSQSKDRTDSIRYLTPPSEMLRDPHSEFPDALEGGLETENTEHSRQSQSVLLDQVGQYLPLLLQQLAKLSSLIETVIVNLKSTPTSKAEGLLEAVEIERLVRSAPSLPAADLVPVLGFLGAVERKYLASMPLGHQYLGIQAAGRALERMLRYRLRRDLLSLRQCGREIFLADEPDQELAEQRIDELKSQYRTCQSLEKYPDYRAIKKELAHIDGVLGNKRRESANEPPR